MRSRQRVIADESGWSYTITHSNPLSSNNYSGTTPQRVYSDEQMWDTVVPGYSSRSAKGEVFVNSMTNVKYDASVTESRPITVYYAPNDDTIHYSNGDRFFKQDGVGMQGSVEHSLFSTVPLRILSSTRAHADVLAPDFAGFVFLAELRESLHMLRNPLSSLEKALKKARRKVPKGQNLLDFMSDSWLAYRYGWRPLISDIDAAAKAVDSYRKPLPERHTARGYAQASKSLSETESSSISVWEIQKDIVKGTEASCRAGILYEYDGRNAFGTSYRDVPMAIWETIPFSFVADWFVNFGDFIEAITPKLGVKVLGSWNTLKITNTSTVDLYATGCGAGTGYSLISSGGFVTEMKRIYTARENRVRAPSLAGSEVILDGNLGLGRVLDSIALCNTLIFSRNI